MRLYYGMADREPHSDALRFRGEEWFEDVAGQLGLDSWSRILNLDQNTLWVPGRPDPNFPPAFCGRADCVDGVHDQVDQYLLHQHRVAGHARQIGRKFGAQEETISRKFGAQEHSYVTNDLVDVYFRP